MAAADPPRGRWLRNAPSWHGHHCACGQRCRECLRRDQTVVIGPPVGCRAPGLAARWVGVYERPKPEARP